MIKKLIFLTQGSDECSECTAGHYCPLGSGTDPTTNEIECPKGSYNPEVRKSDKLNCLKCDEGKFCDSTGLSSPAGDCSQVIILFFTIPLLQKQHKVMDFKIILFFFNYKALFGSKKL